MPVGQRWSTYAKAPIARPAARDQYLAHQLDTWISCSSSGKHTAGERNSYGLIKICHILSLCPGYLDLSSRTRTTNFSPFRVTRSTEFLKRYPGYSRISANRLDSCRVIILARSTRALHLGTILRANPTRGALLVLIGSQLPVRQRIGTSKNSRQNLGWYRNRILSSNHNIRLVHLPAAFEDLSRKYSWMSCVS